MREGSVSAVHEERGPDLGEVIADGKRVLAVALGRRHNSQCPQELGGRSAGITRTAQLRMQPLSREVMKHEVYDAPGIECLSFWHVAAIHGLLRAGFPGLGSPRVAPHQIAPPPHRPPPLYPLTCPP